VALGIPEAIENGTLAGLLREDLAFLLPRLERVDLPIRAVLASPNAPIGHAYFVKRGMVSLVQPLQDGAMVGVGLIGSEGFVGVPLVLGTRADPVEAMVQIAGTALRIPAPALQAAIRARPFLAAPLLHFAHALLVQIAQTAACNSRHSLEERLARWLLMAGDRAREGVFPLSHELLSMMLGARRPGITVAMGVFRRAGLISNSHHHIAILDRPGLEAAACECYATVRDQYRLLLAGAA
jgi:CRP-like cAMP-binding protein